jgi:hypothetical protein
MVGDLLRDFEFAAVLGYTVVPVARESLLPCIKGRPVQGCLRLVASGRRIGGAVFFAILLGRFLHNLYRVSSPSALG